jgi:murein DD-endopeptidase MepM/ murein hydrolase activator NlpD
LRAGPPTFPGAGDINHMTESARDFPTPKRAAIVAAALVLLSVVSTVAGAAPSKESVERARRRIEAIEDELAAVRARLSETQERLHLAAAAVERQEMALEKVTADLVRTQAELDRVRARYDRVVERLNERAVEAYMLGPASSLDFLLGAETVADLTDQIAYVDALAQSDAELAVRVANLKNRLTAIEARLAVAQAREARQLEKARERQADVEALFAEVEGLVARQQSLLDEAERVFRTRRKARERWLERQREAQRAALGGRSWSGGGLGPYDHVFEVCPVAQPRGFGDGFGAPRYGGGYHLHKGVDIVAPLGTEIYAPFDGYSYVSSNSLGGNVVFVVGAVGRVYNAHLVRYSEHSSGPVSAGDVIGYVGSTGSSSTPHDHFEFHPNAMPGGDWPKSAYGYAVIEDAINPYPLLIQACG